ncbi:unnamed protein product [Didymodactylos carnosus]|uniref:Uncharacterized protein n=1 Tax=Didymodactylos carnosus TaxID=1234261 RepID=A0A8S2EM69_9BILA|nr:unnamed protein product [Didymodactylos carnosus]CAF4057033.1 unnamed protein product [Didymodactylos carnosus]
MADSSECSLQNRSKLASTSTPLRTISLNNASSSTSKRDLIPPLVESECLHNITAIIPPEESFIEQSLSAFGTSDVYQNPITFPDYNITNDEISYSPHNFEDGAMRAIKQALIDSDNHVMSTSEEEIKDYILKRKSKRQFWLTQTMSDEFSIVPRIDNLYLLDHLEKYQKLVIEFTLKNSRSDTAEVRTEVSVNTNFINLFNWISLSFIGILDDLLNATTYGISEQRKINKRLKISTYPALDIFQYEELLQMDRDTTMEPSKSRIRL